MASAPEPDAPPGGDVEWPALAPATRAVELLLRAPDERVYRLAWKAGDADRRRRVPPGVYALLGYRIARRDAAGENWFVSTTSNGKFKLRVRAGRTTVPPVDPRIRLKVRAPVVRGQQRFAAGILGRLKTPVLQKPRALGLSIYRAGKRIPAEFRALDAKGETVFTGPMKYG